MNGLEFEVHAGAWPILQWRLATTIYTVEFCIIDSVGRDGPNNIVIHYRKAKGLVQIKISSF